MGIFGEYVRHLSLRDAGAVILHDEPQAAAGDVDRDGHRFVATRAEFEGVFAQIQRDLGEAHLVGAPARLVIAGQLPLDFAAVVFGDGFEDVADFRDPIHDVEFAHGQRNAS